MFSRNNSLVIIDNNMIITYDIRIEAVYCLLILGGYSIISPYSKKYQMKIFQTFRDILENDYVKHYSKICVDKFRYVIPCAFALSTQYENGVIHQRGAMKEEYIKQLGGTNEVEKCVESINSFINESNYLKFYQENQDEYLEYLKKHRNLLFSVMNDVQKWYGEENMNYTAYLSQLVHAGGFGVGIDSPTCVLGCILNPDYTVNESLSINVYFHEFSHYFIDKFILVNWQDIHRKVSHLSNIFSSDDYLNVLCHQEVFSESIIRAIANYYCYKQSKSVNARDFIEYPYSHTLYEIMKKKGIIYINSEVLEMLLSEVIELMNKEKVK